MNENISIIIPIYNSEEYLKKCIESVLNQTYKNIEVLLIDDGSSDKSGQICDEYAKIDNRVKVIHKNNEGVSTARNVGIEKANGEYITFIDSDDSIDLKYIEKLYQNTEEDCLIKQNNKEKLNENIIERNKYIEYLVSGKIKGVCWGYLFETSKAKEIMFDKETSHMEDTIFVLEYLKNVSKVKILEENLYIQNIHNDSLTTRRSNIEKAINGYSYSICKIQEYLNKNNISYDERLLQNRKIKLIEAEFVKAQAENEIRKLLDNENVKEILKTTNISFKYKVFIYVVKKRNVGLIIVYIKIREILKKYRKTN